MHLTQVYATCSVCHGRLSTNAYGIRSAVFNRGGLPRLFVSAPMGGRFQLPRCGGSGSWDTAKGLVVCKTCGYNASVTAGTIFENTHKPLMLWFRAMWWITSLKTGVSALAMQKALGLGSYRTAWTWLHKLRRVIVRSGRDRLSGRIEVDETYVGASERGLRGRKSEKKALVYSRA